MQDLKMGDQTDEIPENAGPENEGPTVRAQFVAQPVEGW